MSNTPQVYYLKKLPFKYNGLTIPPFGIFIKEDQKENRALLEHELVHWRQFKKEGLIFFILKYIWFNIKYGYDANPYELEARFNESDFCKNNYTYCVRNGLAKTVYNPNFRKGKFNLTTVKIYCIFVFIFSYIIYMKEL